MDEGLIDGPAAMTAVSQFDRVGTRHRADPADDQFSQVGGDRSGPQMRAGQVDRELDLDERGRGEASSNKPSAGAPLRRGLRGDGVRRAGAGRPPPDRKVAICTRAYHLLTEKVGFPARTSSSIPTSSQSPPASRNTTISPSPISRRRGASRPKAALRARVGRRIERLVRFPRQRARARGDALGVPLSRDPGRHGHGHRQCRPARAL